MRAVRRDGRVVECTGLENRQGFVAPLGFKSLSLHHLFLFVDLFQQITIRIMRWRGGRVAEGAPLLREYRVCSSIEGSNPSFSTIFLKMACLESNMCGRVAQLDRVPGYEPGGRRFESSRVRHFLL